MVNEPRAAGSVILLTGHQSRPDPVGSDRSGPGSGQAMRLNVEPFSSAWTRSAFCLSWLVAAGALDGCDAAVGALFWTRDCQAAMAALEPAPPTLIPIAGTFVR